MKITSDILTHLDELGIEYHLDSGCGIISVEVAAPESKFERDEAIKKYADGGDVVIVQHLEDSKRWWTPNDQGTKH